MAGSAAEERIRETAVALLRNRYPDGRIIHELVLQEGTVRIDLACVTPELVVVAEIKSERDVLDRLPLQVEVAHRCTDGLVVCTTPAHAEKIEHLSSPYLREMVMDARGYGRSAPNPDYDRRLSDVIVLQEGELGLFERRWGWNHPQKPAHVSPFARLRLLWAAELRAVAAAARIGVSARTPRYDCIERCAELMTGREIRRAVCAQLRQRSFPRADPAL